MMGNKDTFFILILLIFALSCANKKQCNKEEISSLKESLDNEKIRGFINNKEYIIYPYFTEFGQKKWFLESLEDKEKEIYKNNFLSLIDYSESSFEKLKKNVDDLYYRKSCEKLKKLTNSKKGKTIICFSGVSERMFFVDIYNLRGDKIPVSEISKNNIFNRDTLDKLNFASYVVHLDKRGKIRDVNIVLLSGT